MGLNWKWLRTNKTKTTNEQEVWSNERTQMRAARAVHSQLAEKRLLKINFFITVDNASGFWVGQSKDAFFFLGFSLVAY